MMDEKQWGITVALKMYIQKLCVCFDDNDSHILGMSVSPDKKFVQVLRQGICSCEVCLNWRWPWGNYDCNITVLWMHACMCEYLWYQYDCLEFNIRCHGKLYETVQMLHKYLCNL